MARPKGVKQKRDESKYWLPVNVSLVDEQVDYNKETKLKFIDAIHGEFTSYFKALQDANASTHPLAIKERREQTNLQRYGTINAGSTKESRTKAQDTMLRKYGVKNALESKVFLDKSKETLRNNHGVDHPMQSLELKEKLKQSMINKHGVNNPGKINAFRILPNGKNIKEYCKEKGINACFAYQMYNNYGPQSAQEWIDNHKEKISCLEKDFKLMFPSAERYEKVPEGVKHFRPDFKIGNLFIDLDGLMYHSDEYKEDKHYHFNKRLAYEQAGYQLLQFRQDELILKKEIVKSIINAKTGNISKKLYARKLTIRSVSKKDTDLFLNRTHLMGITNGTTNIGLYNENELVSLITFKQIQDNGIDIARFSNELNTIIVGGLSKLLNYIKEEYNPTFIQSFVDMRYGNGSSLLQLGYKLVSCNLSWKWTDNFKTYNRLHCRANMDDRKLSEKEYAKEMKLHKIYDAGQAKFIFTYR